VNTGHNEKRNSTTCHKNNYPHNYPLFFFLEVKNKPIAASTTKTMQPAIIKIFCGSPPFNIPPKMKLANVNFAKSSNNLPRLSPNSEFGCIGLFFMLPIYTFYIKKARKKSIKRAALAAWYTQPSRKAGAL